MPTSDKEHQRPEVLAVPEASVATLFHRPAFYSDSATICMVLEAIATQGRYVDRGLAEQDASVKQVVAYGLIHHGNRVLCLRRTARSNRKTLRLRYTLLFGGHVDSLEKYSNSALETCLLRELDEELGISPSGSLTLLGIAIDPTTVVGELHMGLIFDVPVKEEVIEVPSSLDNAEFVNASRHNRYELQFIDRLLDKTFDSWSSLFLASDSCERLLGLRHASSQQIELPLDWSMKTPE